eukprot:14500031-Alexandrium_andersonii.AAC.1
MGEPRPRGGSATVPRPAYRLKPSRSDLTRMPIPQRCRTEGLAFAQPNEHQAPRSVCVLTCGRPFP